MSETNKQIGDYEILDELGAGGMGRVYRVRNVISDRIEAMKVLLPDLAGRQELAARFVREIKLLASLDHPNIAALRTAFTANNQLIMIMEYIEGTSLAARIERGPIAVTEAVDYVDQVLSALSYAHQRQVIHRDIKPANMMLTPQGVVKLMDFGIARSGEDRSLTQTGTTLGSLNYMSPEQVKGQTADARSDLYSLGISLYEMVTGQLPFQADSDYAIMAAQVKESPRAPIELQPGLPAALNEIILTAIAKEPEKRFQSADAFRNALSSLRPASAPRPSTGSRQATLVDTAVTATLVSPVQGVTAPVVNSQPPSDHARTVLDTRSQAHPVAPAQPAAPPPQSSMPPPASSHKGLYMAVGALLLVAALAGATIYINYSKNGKAAANPTTETKSPATQRLSKPHLPATSQPQPLRSQAPPLPPTKAVVAPPVTQAAKKSRMGAMAGQEASTQPVAPAPSPQNTAELDDLEHQVDQLTARSAAVNSSLDTLRQRQNAAGYGLRGDIAARQESMKLNLSKAQDAVQHGDVERAKRYLPLAESDVEALEQFLGR
ncbi:MAG TPA: protein kinase [Terriglobales bacterium]|nr:protein kinase [Terriglobales bacterium]